MPIVLKSFAPSLLEVGRIRLGEKQGNRPSRLADFRLTSPHRDALEAAAELFGGEVRPWNDPMANPPEQFELYTETNSLPVIVPPAHISAFDQWLEKWDRGGLVLRTDGEVDASTGELLDTPVPESQEGQEAMGLKPVTRLSVLIEGVPGFGTWRLETHSYYAAKELSANYEAAMSAGISGSFNTARLVLGERVVKRRDASGKPMTKKFPVVQLILDVTAEQIHAGELHMRELAAGKNPLAIEAGPMKALHEKNGFDPDDPMGLDADPMVPSATAGKELLAAFKDAGFEDPLEQAKAAASAAGCTKSLGLARSKLDEALAGIKPVAAPAPGSDDEVAEGELIDDEEIDQGEYAIDADGEA